MESRQLRHFLAVVDHGSVTRAADILGIAQPALSQSITRLEQSMGVQLLQRTRRGAELTAAGRAIVGDVRQALNNIDRAELRARDIAAGHAGLLTIGMVSSALVHVLPRALRRLRRAEPRVQVVLREMSNSELYSAVRRGEIDIALMHTPPELDPEIREEILLRDRLIAAVPSSYRVEQEGRISMVEMARMGLVSYPQRHLPAFTAGILDAFRHHGHRIAVVQEANRTLTVLACVAAGLGVALLPTWIKSLSIDGVRYCEAEHNGSLPAFDLTAVWLRREERTLADAFFEAATP